MAAVGLFLVTSLLGRVWCGYTCPQTVWTDLFMWIEHLVEGDRNERMKRDAGPTTFDSAWRKVVKHGTWLGVAFWTGGAWIMYYVDAPTVTVEFWTGTASKEVYFFTALFTATTYLFAGWAREQVCTYMCPWPRFQSAMLDEQSLTVTYQGWRGEPRLRGRRHDDTQGGDCIDCGACVTACPTGIDIRDGIQLECINCGLCVDACNHVMERTGRPKWLITWDTLADQAAKAEGRQATFKFLRPRTIIYVSALFIAVSVMTVALATRSSVGLSVLHDRAPLFVRLPDGSLRNGYTVKIANKGPTPDAVRTEHRGSAGCDPGGGRRGPRPGGPFGPAGESRQCRHVSRAGERQAGRPGRRFAADRLRAAQCADGRADGLSLGIHGAAMSYIRWIPPRSSGHTPEPARSVWRLFPWLRCRRHGRGRRCQCGHDFCRTCQFPRQDRQRRL